jgi:hypothetical protein
VTDWLEEANHHDQTEVMKSDEFFGAGAMDLRMSWPRRRRIRRAERVHQGNEGGGAVAVVCATERHAGARRRHAGIIEDRRSGSMWRKRRQVFVLIYNLRIRNALSALSCVEGSLYFVAVLA